MLVAAAAISSDLGLSQRIGGHKSLSSTLRYTKATAIGDNLRVTAQLVVPYLDTVYGSYDDLQVNIPL